MEASAGVEQRYQDLLKRARESFSKADTVPILKELEGGNIQIRQMRDGEDIITIGEFKKIDGLVPADYKMFFDAWGPASVEINDTCLRVDEVDQEDGHKVVKMELKFPWPLWNRLMILTLYPRYDQENDEQIFFFASHGNDAMKAKHWTETDEKNYQYATQPIGGWILTPLKDEAGTVTGTHMWFINCANVGGNIPESLVTS